MDLKEKKNLIDFLLFIFKWQVKISNQFFKLKDEAF